MKIPYYHVDSFATKLFAGNPAAVCILEKWLPDHLLQSIATENHLPATAFLVKDDQYSTRWFTPEYEIDLCGHGTLALGHVIFNDLEPTLRRVDLHSPAGLLRISKQNELITLDFPIKSIEHYASPLLEQGLGYQPKAVYRYKAERCLAILDNEEQIKNIKPDMQVLKQLEFRGVIVSAVGVESDFVSRVFYPNKLLSEDAVTGSSHCLLVPYWSNVLNKFELHSRQLSHRGGDVFCELKNDRVYLSGKATTYMQGFIEIN
jgi:PhzF family phenazine biosynthesis protein